MPRADTDPSLRRTALPTLLIAGVGAAAFFSPASTAAETNPGHPQNPSIAPAKIAEPFPIVPIPIQPANTVAAMLQQRIRHGQEVPYNANVGIKHEFETPGTTVEETTIAPLEYTVDGQKEWFKLIGNAVRKLRVVKIPNPVDVIREHWVPQHPGVTVTSNEGVISTDNRVHIPATDIHLSNGDIRLAPIGQTSAVG